MCRLVAGVAEINADDGVGSGIVGETFVAPFVLLLLSLSSLSLLLFLLFSFQLPRELNCLAIDHRIRLLFPSHR